MCTLLYHKELNVTSSIEGLEEILVIIKEIENIFKLDFEKKLSLQTVIVESVENPIIHGNRNIRELKVRFCITITVNEIIIEVEDQGEGYLLDMVSSPINELNIRKESGRGIFFIKCFSKSFYLLGKGNIIKINIDR